MNTLYILCGPTGSGKTTLSELLEKDSQAPVTRVIITCTSRPQRPYEIDGVHFHFKSHYEMQRMQDQGELFEFAENHEHLYGTPWSFIEGIGNKLVIFDIGAAVRAKDKLFVMNRRCRIIFLQPVGGINDIVPRLKRRGESPERIEVRTRSAVKEMRQRDKADYIIGAQNGNLLGAYRDLVTILRADRLRVNNESSAYTDQ